MEEKKYFYFAVRIEEHNGEQEYNHLTVERREQTPRFKNITQKRLDQIADETAKHWYMDEAVKVDDYYEFFGGTLTAQPLEAREITKEQYEFLQTMLNGG